MRHLLSGIARQCKAGKQQWSPSTWKGMKCAITTHLLAEDAAKSARHDLMSTAEKMEWNLDKAARASDEAMIDRYIANRARDAPPPKAKASMTDKQA